MFEVNLAALKKYAVVHFSLILAFVSFAMLHFGREINSDHYTTDLIYLDLVSNFQILKGWSLPPAPYFFPEMPLIFLFRALGMSFFTAMYFFGITMMVLLSYSITLAVSYFQPQAGTPRIFAYSLISVSCLALLIGPIKAWNLSLPVFDSSFHSGQLIFGILWISLLLFKSDDVKRSLIYITCAIAFLITISDFLFIVQFGIPLGVIFLISWFILRRPDFSKLLFFNLISIGLGYIFIKIFKMNMPEVFGSIGVLVFATPERMTKITSEIFKTYFDPREFIFITVLGTIFFYKALMLFSKATATVENTNLISKQSKWKLFGIFQVLSIALSIFFVVVSGYWFGFSEMRYLMNILVFPFLVFLIAIFAHNYRYTHYIVPFAWFAFFVHSLFLYKPAVATTPQSLECLRRHIVQNNLENGIASYWEAKKIRSLTVGQIQLTQVAENFEFFNHIHNRAWQKKDAQGQNLKPDFVVLNLAQPTYFDEEELVAKFGSFKNLFVCENFKLFQL